MNSTTTATHEHSKVTKAVKSWLGFRPVDLDSDQKDEDKVDWVRAVPFILLHLACIAVLWVGISWIAVAVAVALYLVRMFVITTFYHRYFSHRAFKTSRFVQAMAAFIGATAAQRGALWWAAHHRHHHLESDTEHDLHSPRHRGMIMAHCGWFLTDRAFNAPSKLTRDWNRFPELVWMDRFCLVPPILLLVMMFGLGYVLNAYFPGLGTSGWQMVIWGFCISTVVTYHATYAINSLAHRFGSARFKTDDDSRNNFWLALLTLGEGWHNNHHHYPASARQGFFWWEIDISYYMILGMRFLRLVHDVRMLPPRVIDAARNQALNKGASS